MKRDVALIFTHGGERRRVFSQWDFYFILLFSVSERAKGFA
jgi:hypothetical protein